VKKKILIFYLFHDHPEVTAQRLIHLLKSSQDISVVVCYGGVLSLFDNTIHEVIHHAALMGEDLQERVDFVFNMVKSPWYNADLLVSDWFARYGNAYDFDILVYIEYDVLLFESLTDIVAQQPSFDLAVSLTDNVETPEWDWLKRPTYPEYLKWRERYFHVARDQKVLNAFPPMFLLTRSALHAYTNLYIANRLPPVFLEIRFPNTLQCLGFNVVKANFGPTMRWRPPFSKEEVMTKLEEMKMSDEKFAKIFHPFASKWK
jgi:hypothetical protein